MNLLTFWNCISILFLVFAFFFYSHTYPSTSSLMAEQSSKSIYDFTVKRVCSVLPKFLGQAWLIFELLILLLLLIRQWYLTAWMKFFFLIIYFCFWCELYLQDIRGNEVSLNDYSGKVILIVNVASQCGLTQTNYKELNALYDKYKNQGFEILAFPCNQFAGQEPGNNEEIQEVVCTRFKAEFPIFDKVEVNGKNAAPLYKFLKEQKGGIFGDGIKWNFTKFLVNKEGKVVERYAPTTSPLKIEKDIEKLLQS
ncbi:hypothetical protein V8G54_003904 [Vigna mungo]|uniref:Glutathione peroxidase n=1 Tax=Vigna mungo TaxID=3915 RepID=A0AAQ3PD56_VIGMU